MAERHITVSWGEQPLPRSFDGVFYGAAGTPTGEFDNQFNRVSFLSHFEGANNGVNNAFDDGSASNRTITNAGNTSQGSFGPFARPDGEWGVSFDGSGDVLKTPSITIGTGTITYECWLNFNTVAGNATIVSFNDSSGDRVSVYNSGGDLRIYSSANGGRTVKSNAFTTPNSWIKLLLVRASNTATVYLDGTSVGTGTMPENLTGVLAIGAYTGSEVFNGVISNVRLSDNARHSGNYTVEKAPLTSDSNTDLLTCQSNRFVDNSSNGHTMTPSGNPAVTAFGPFLTSAVYDAAVNGASSRGGTSGDNYVYAGTSSDFHFGSGNFTIELWTYPLGSGKNLMACGGGSIVSSSINFNYGGNFDFYYQSTQLNLASPTLTLNSWQYITVVRNGGTITVYKDGVATGTVTIGSNSLNTGGSSPFYIGGYPQAQGGNINGYLSDVRVVKGTAVYTSNFTPPTAPLTAITNTKLLLNMKNAQAIDSAAQNNLTLFGNAKLSTGQAKFGDTSLLLDGTGDFAQAGNFEDLAGPFTIECFARADDTGNAFLWCLGQYRLELGINGNTLRIYRIGTSTGYTNFFTSGEFSATNWHHVALVRDTSNVIKCYLNGTASGTTVTDATAFVATNNILIIGGEADGAPSGGAINLGWDGYVDDFRVSKFARYTSNFTAPSEPFSDRGQDA